MGTTYQVKCDRCPKSYLTTDDTPPFWCGCDPLEEATELLTRLSDRFACAACHSSSHVAVKGSACACGYSDVITFLRKVHTNGD